MSSVIKEINFRLGTNDLCMHQTIPLCGGRIISQPVQPERFVIVNAPCLLLLLLVYNKVKGTKDSR